MTLHGLGEMLALFLFLCGFIYLLLRDETKHWPAMQQYLEEKNKLEKDSLK